MEQYCCKSKITFKALLLLDSAFKQSVYLSDLHPHVRLMFLPPNKPSTMQPLYQGVITFKMNYLQRTFSQLLDGTEGPDRPTICELWLNYTILHAVNNIKSAWDKVQSITMNGAWKSIWKECVHDCTGVVNLSSEVAGIVSLGRKIGFKDLNEDDVLELLKSHERKSLWRI